jgi:hypothetical protein
MEEKMSNQKTGGFDLTNSLSGGQEWEKLSAG